MGRSELGSEFVVERDGLGKRLFTEARRARAGFNMAEIPFELQVA